MINHKHEWFTKMTHISFININRYYMNQSPFKKQLLFKDFLLKMAIKIPKNSYLLFIYYNCSFKINDNI
jgi:hypothetical protein